MPIGLPDLTQQDVRDFTSALRGKAQALRDLSSRRGTDAHRRAMDDLRNFIISAQARMPRDPNARPGNIPANTWQQFLDQLASAQDVWARENQNAPPRTTAPKSKKQIRKERRDARRSARRDRRERRKAAREKRRNERRQARETRRAQRKRDRDARRKLPLSKRGDVRREQYRRRRRAYWDTRRKANKEYHTTRKDIREDRKKAYLSRKRTYDREMSARKKYDKEQKAKERAARKERKYRRKCTAKGYSGRAYRRKHPDRCREYVQQMAAAGTTDYTSEISPAADVGYASTPLYRNPVVLIGGVVVVGVVGALLLWPKKKKAKKLEAKRPTQLAA